MLVVFYQLYIPQCIYFYTEFYLDEKDGERFTFHNVSISTLYGMYTINILQDFTFHNVSISTLIGWMSTGFSRSALHSTMYLFLRLKR